MFGASPSDPVANNKESSGTAAPEPHPDTFPPVGHVSPRRSGAVGEGELWSWHNCFLAKMEIGLAFRLGFFSVVLFYCCSHQSEEDAAPNTAVFVLDWTASGMG